MTSTVWFAKPMARVGTIELAKIVANIIKLMIIA